VPKLRPKYKGNKTGKGNTGSSGFGLRLLLRNQASGAKTRGSTKPTDPMEGKDFPGEPVQQSGTFSILLREYKDKGVQGCPGDWWGNTVDRGGDFYSSASRTDSLPNIED